MTFRGRARPITRRFAGGRGARRRVEWERAVYETQQVDPTSEIVTLPLANAARLDSYTRPTIVRIIGSVDLISGDETLGNTAEGAMGIYLVDDALELPDPYLQGRKAWMWWRPFRIIASANLESSASHQIVDFDVRAQRKVLSEGSDLLFVITLLPSSTAPVCFQIGASTLVKE